MFYDIAQQAIVTAEDADSPGHVLRCDVIVDEIRSLQIVTKTHDLYLEEPPEEFAVRAYDEQGNEFSTLEKIVFKWNIENIVKQKSTGDNIRFINFRDSEYALETSVMEIEASGRQGSKVLLEGIKTGKSLHAETMHLFRPLTEVLLFQVLRKFPSGSPRRCTPRFRRQRST